jgi:MarR family transcriptional regulator, organic hydroperoxide resistance regulator
MNNNATDKASLRVEELLCFALYVTARASEASYRPVFSKLGLTYPRYIVLMVLSETDGIPMSTLGSRLYLDSGTLTPLVKGMAADGLVTRRRNPLDERSVQVSLTKKGREISAKAIAAAQSVACTINIPPREVARIRDELKRVHAALTPGKDAGKHSRRSAAPG